MYHLQQEPSEISHHLFRLLIATPEKVIFQGNILSLYAPGKDGYFEILVNHAAFMAALHSGKVIVTQADKSKIAWAITGGLFEIDKNKASLLADACEPLKLDAQE